jgi:translocation and assembly module TamB
VRRAARIALVVALGLVLLAALAAGAILASGPGHAVARRLALAMAAQAVDGRVEIGSVGGTLWRSADLRDVVLETPDGRPVIKVARLVAHYSVASLLRHRYVFSRVEIERPTVVLEPEADGRLSLEHCLRLVGPSAPHPGPRPVVELHGVRLTGGTVVLREHDGPGETTERRFVGVTLDLARLRASNPDSTGVVADVRRLAVAISDPAVRVRDAAGRVAIEGDSVRFRLTRLDLASSEGSAQGTVRWGAATDDGRSWLDLAASFRRASFADFRWALAGLPRTGGGRVDAQVQLWPHGGSAWSFRDIDVTTGRSALRGSASFTVGSPGAVTMQALDLDAQPLELALLAPFTGPIPVAGLVRGHLTAAGPLVYLTVGADLTFADEQVPAQPPSAVAASGVVALGGAHGLSFHHLTLARADVALATIEHLVPAITLKGRARLVGDLDGPWSDATFEGVLDHEDGPGPGSTLRGAIRLTLADTVAVHADVVADSLSLDDLARSYPVIAVRGTFAGPLHVDGPLPAMAVKGDLTSAAGGLRAEGEVAVGDSAVRIRVAGALDRVDLAQRIPGAPRTSLTGTWRLGVTLPSADSTAPVTGSITVGLDGSEVSHIVWRHAGAKVALTPTRIEVDTVYADQPGMDLFMSGAIGLPGQPSGQLRFGFRADTLATLWSLVAWLSHAAGDSALQRLDLRGAGRISGRVEGTTELWAASGDVHADSLAYGTLSLGGAAAGGTLARSARGYRFGLHASADSVIVSTMRYGDVSVDVEGPADSLQVRAAAAFGPGSSAEVSANVRTDSAGWTARFEHGAVVLAGHDWALTGHPSVTLAGGVVAVDSLEWRAPGAAAVRLAGRLPRATAGDLRLAADSVPLADLYALAEKDTTGIGGTLTGSLRLAGTAAEPRLEARAAVVRGRFGDFNVPLLAVSAAYADRRLEFHAQLGAAGEPVVTASGSLPVDLALEAVDRRQLPGALDIRARADSVDLSIVDALTTLVRGVGGRLAADVAVGGTWEEPQLTGTARIVGGSAGIPALGARYSGIEARLSMAGDRLHVEEARVRGGSGTLAITGDVRFPSLTEPVLDLRLEARNFAAFNLREFAGLTGSGTLSLRGPLLGATLSGQWTVDAGFLAFADLVEKRIVNLDDPEFRAVVDSNLAQAADLGPTAQNVFLDSLRIQGLTVSMGPDVWLRSHEASIQLAGSFTVAKDVVAGVGRYRLDGTLRATRGTYRLVVGPTAKDFRVTRGTVRFFGTPDLNPVLDIAAEHTVRAVNGNDLVVRVVIGGTLLVPKLSLESDERPPLSESEIVSYLLFGRPTFDLSSGGAGVAGTSEQAILQGAMAGLAGVVSGELEQTLVTNLGIPVDYLAIRPGGGSVGGIFSSTRVEAGTQLGERTFLTVNAGLCQVVRGSQALGASIEHRLDGRFTVEASIEPTVQECRPGGFQIRPPVPYQVGFDLFWQWGTP